VFLGELMSQILNPNRQQNVILWLVLALSCWLPFCSAKDKVILDVNSVDWPPFFLDPKQLNQPGLARELLTFCINGDQYDIRFMHLPIKRTHHYMQKGQLDLAVYSFKPEREDFVWYSAVPMFHSEIGVAARRDFIQPITNETELEPWRIGYLAGLGLTPTLAVLLAGKKTQNKAIEDYSMANLFDQLITTPSRIELVINSREALLWMSQLPKYQGKVKVLDFALERKAYYLAVSKKSSKLKEPTQFLKQFDQCVQKMRLNGQYQRLLQGYQLQDS
jgi:polar amino acid transport system substrate-binding protein